MSQSLNNILTSAQVAKELDITARLVRQYCKEGRLGQKLGGRYLITRNDLETFKAIPRKVGRPRKE